MHTLRTIPIAIILLALTAPTAAQEHDYHVPTHRAPYWLHIAPVGGAVSAARPGDPGRPVAALQLETSRAMPFGLGVAGGYVFDDDSFDPGEPVGPFAEALFVYRFHLWLGGRFSPYAGPVVGVLSDDVGAETRELRWHFGGRAGVDIPTPDGWPAIRIETSYRNFSEVAGRGSAGSALVLVGGRWSFPIEP